MFSATIDPQQQMLQGPPRPLTMEGRWKSGAELAPNCPRCASPNTKFCYYNNYSLSQPRYFCKACRRYWTKGGSLRNVPVGGGCRKNRRSRSARSSASHTDRTGLSYLRNPPSPGDESLSPGGSDGSSGTADIDMAAVFAKYLNQNSGPENKSTGEDSSSGGSSATTPFDLPISSLEEMMMIELFESSGNPSHLTHETVLQDDHVAQFMGQEDLNGFGLQSELPQDDGSWSDSPNLPNFMWQPMVQLQDFGSFLPDDSMDHLKGGSSDLIGDNWSSIDQLGYEIFSRP